MFEIYFSIVPVCSFGYFFITLLLSNVSNVTTYFQTVIYFLYETFFRVNISRKITTDTSHTHHYSVKGFRLFGHVACYQSRKIGLFWLNLHTFIRETIKTNVIDHGGLRHQ